MFTVYNQREIEENILLIKLLGAITIFRNWMLIFGFTSMRICF